MKRTTRPRVRLIAAALITALILTLPMAGVEPRVAGPAAVLETLLTSGLLALAWMLGAWGIGSLIAQALHLPRRYHAEASLGIGVAAMLWLSHLMGITGCFGAGITGAVLAWLPVVGGVSALLWKPSRTRAPVQPASWTTLLAIPGIAVLLIASCVPPGAAWRSEAFAFDELSYHLQLPREWLAAGRIEPLTHNTYSWLPSYMEAAYTHLGAMAQPFQSADAGSDSFVGGEGVATLASHILHALMAIAAAWIAGSFAAREARRAGGRAAGALAAGITSSIALLIPWVIVTGSLAYNEMALNMLFAAAILIAADHRIPAARRWLLAGFLMGVATATKPTAFYMAGPPVAIFLLARTPRREWGRGAGLACAAGLLALAPWLLRNWHAGASPVFPYATTLLGTGHWTIVEVQRWNSGAHIHANLVERFGLLFSSRGILHPQWAGFFFIVIGACVAARARPLQKPGLPLVAALIAQLACWMCIGHLQSRFLLPCIVPGAALIGITASRIARRRRIATILIVVTALALGFNIIRVYLANPNANRALVGGVPTFTGEWMRGAPAPELDRAALGPYAYINLKRHESSAPLRVYLLGDSTPFYLRTQALYHTTWERSPLGDELELAAGDPRLALRQFQDKHHITQILINRAEIERLTRDGWYDPRMTPAVVDEIARTLAPARIAAWPDNDAWNSALFDLSRDW